MSDSIPSVLCVGEILWDFLPRGAFPGGAPFNVAYHLHRLGLKTHLVSAVGRDLLGDELLSRLRQWGLSTEGVGRHTGLPTGYVRASIGPTGDATYEIATQVAWDQIILGEDTIRAAFGASALVFGSLAMRSRSNRTALDRLLAVLPATALRVFDVNLRPPYDDLPLVRELARKATLLKLNAGEAARLTNEPPEPGREEAHAHALVGQTGCTTVCISSGERGAGLLVDGKWTWTDSRPVVVRDTVGAGDAFMAGLLSGLILHREKPAVALDRACRMGEYVAARDGATPPYECDPLGQPTDRK
ncbi:MAG: carbohydrate kinase [Lacunisphaera sp.]